MATIYVSQTATNGFGVGDDARTYATAQTITTPLLTIESAISKGTAGDTIVINDGIYTHATFFTDNKGFIFRPYNPYMVTMKQGGGQARVLHKTGTGNISIGPIILDVEGGAQAVTVASAASGNAVTLDGTTLRGGTTYGLRNDSAIITLTILRANITAALDCVYNSISITSGSLYMDVCFLVSTAHTSTGGGNVRWNAANTGISGIIRNSVMYMTGSNSGISNVTFNNAQLLLENCDIYTAGTSGSAASVKVGTLAAVEANYSIIRNNRFYHSSNSGSASGYFVLVGEDTSEGSAGAFDNMVNYPSIFRNVGVGTPGGSPLLHGYMLGWNKGGCVTNNLALHCAIAYLSKNQSERAYFVDNDYNQGQASSTGGVLRAKGSTNTIFAGNRARTTATDANWFQIVTVNDDNAQDSSGIAYVANNLKGNWTASKVNSVETGSTAAFSFNNYDLDAVTGNPFVYTASTYASLALWAAAQELNYEARGFTQADPWAYNRMSGPHGKIALGPVGGGAPWGR